MTIVPPDYTAFCGAVEHLLTGLAQEKGYAADPDGPNLLYTFIRDTVGGDHHALGEIIMKVRRFEARRDYEDILKIAAWAFLVWTHRDA